MFWSTFDRREKSKNQNLILKIRMNITNPILSIYIIKVMLLAHCGGLGTLSELNYTSIFVHFYIDNLMV